MKNSNKITDRESPVHGLMMKVLVILLSFSSTVLWGQEVGARQEQASIVKSGLAHQLPFSVRVKKNHKKVPELRISPNPASQEIDIRFPERNDRAEGESFDLEIYSKPGSRVLAKKWNGEKIDVSALPAGVYIITLKRKQEVYSQKLVVNR
ncbi:T9SS type A sorting domain-containing protein [Dyadobacter sp. CY323]|uniref:T9SS type A sorting domain-containing protein n=1 Tax=Dyadobacter sp. CY323 TaxID=2907302 RepID=UPI001F17286C|nr:T9SS type A sorting domain-containing protein [Dyadobacter sp. CY323]MCE6991762.1 T9SS type A sorting domain-containing protein [Dyadobacter sp. CY323]